MTKSKAQIKRDYVESLKRREDFLRERIAEPGGQALTYDKQEANALRWAVGILEALYSLKKVRGMKNDL